MYPVLQRQFLYIHVVSSTSDNSQNSTVYLISVKIYLILFEKRYYKNINHEKQWFLGQKF